MTDTSLTPALMERKVDDQDFLMKYEILACLTNGSFGSVYKVLNKEIQTL